MPVINANSSSTRRIALDTAPTADQRDAHDDALSQRIVQASERHSALWRTFVGASVAVAGVAALGIHAMTPASAQAPAPIASPMNQAAPPNVSIPPPGGSYDKPVIVVVPPSVRPPPPASTTAPPAHIAPVQQGVFAFAPLPAGAKLRVSGTFTTTIVFAPTAIPFAGSAQVVKSDANNLALRINATGVSGIARGQTRTAQLSFTKVDAKHVKLTTQDLTGQTTSTSTLTVIGSNASGTQMRAPDGAMVTLHDAKGTLTISYDQNVIRVAHPVSTIGDS